MEIQQLTAADAATYQALRLFALRESPTAFGSSYGEEVDRPLSVVAQRLADTDNHIFGAYSDEEQLVGVAILRREQHVKSAHKANLFGMYVLPAYRKQGVGRALLETVIRRARHLGLRQINLSVVNDNEAAVALYASCGFERFGLERRAFRVEGHFYDVAYMTLWLDGNE
jgi:ribosomal protein S18 acetylase RimI-like enzyme